MKKQIFDCHQNSLKSSEIVARKGLSAKQDAWKPALWRFNQERLPGHSKDIWLIQSLGNRDRNEKKKTQNRLTRELEIIKSASGLYNNTLIPPHPALCFFYYDRFHSLKLVFSTF